MSYRFKPTESFRDGVRRIGVEQIDAARAKLSSGDDPVVVVHATRKCLKKIRALLRLARPALSADTFAIENARFRDIARTLSVARDTHVMAATLDALAATAKPRAKAALVAAREALEPAAATSVDPALLEAADSALALARVRMARLPVTGRGYGPAFDGMVRTLKQACRASAHAFESGDDEAMHELRKRVQHHWRHMALLSAAWPELLGARAATARQLSQALGDDHDLAVLVQRTADERALPITTARRKQVLAAARRRQSEQRRIAHTGAQRLLSEDVDGFRDRIALYWSTAADDAEAMADAAE